MYNDLTSDEQLAVYNYGYRNGYNVNDPEVLDALANDYNNLIYGSLVQNEVPAIILGRQMTNSSLIYKTQNEIIDIMLDDAFTNLAEYEEYLVKVSHNAKASPLCIHRQGKVYWVNQPVEGYDELDPELFKNGGGLFHPHCRHNMSIYFPGYSDEPLGTGDIDKISGDYEKDQKAKYVEKNKKIWYDRRRRAKLTNSNNYDYTNRKYLEWSNK